MPLPKRELEGKSEEDESVTKKVKLTPPNQKSTIDYNDEDDEDDAEYFRKLSANVNLVQMDFKTGRGSFVSISAENFNEAQSKIEKMSVDEDYKIDLMVDQVDDSDFAPISKDSSKLESDSTTTSSPNGINNDTVTQPIVPIVSPSKPSNTTATSNTTPSKPSNHLQSSKKFTNPLKSTTNTPTPLVPLTIPLKKQPTLKLSQPNNATPLSPTQSTQPITPNKPSTPSSKSLKLTAKPFKSPFATNPPQSNGTNTTSSTTTAIKFNLPPSAIPKQPIKPNSVNINNYVKSSPIPTTTNKVKIIKEIDTRKSLKDLGTPFQTSPIGLIKPNIININRKNSDDFRFDNNNDAKEFKIKAKTIGITEILIYLLTEKFDGKLLTTEWITNHYGWIVWKLASMEKAFPKELGGKYLTINRVINQLKNRYKKEMIDCKRSILRKIYERDETSERHMILCVSDILSQDDQVENTDNNDNDESDDTKKTNQKDNLIELTDGYYSIRAVLDGPLTDYLKQGKIFIGQKLRIQLSQIVGKESGISPLEEGSEEVFLKIFANSTRRARWCDKLGLQQLPLFPITLRSIIPGGGPIGLIKVEIVNTYPLQFKETITHENGSKHIVVRNQNEESAITMEYEKRAQSLYEHKLGEMRDKYENQGSNKSLNGNIKKPISLKKLPVGCKDGAIIYEYYQQAMDQTSFYELLDDDQRNLLYTFREKENQKTNERLQGELMDQIKSDPNLRQRDVKPQLKIKVRDLLSQSPNQHLVQPPSSKDSYIQSSDEIFATLTDLPIFTLNSSKADTAKFTNGNKFVVFDPLSNNNNDVNSNINEEEKPIQIQDGFQTSITIQNPTQDTIDSLKVSNQFLIYQLSQFSQYNSTTSNNRKFLTAIQATSKTIFKRIDKGGISNNGNVLTLNQEIQNFNSFVNNQIKLNQECNLIGLLIYAQPNQITETLQKDGKKIETSKTIYLIDQSGYMAKVVLLRNSYVSGGTTSSNSNEHYYFPFKDGFQLDIINQNTKTSSLPILQLSNLQYKGYDNGNQLLQFVSRDILDIVTKPKSQKPIEIFDHLNRWLLESPGLISTFTFKLKYIFDKSNFNYQHDLQNETLENIDIEIDPDSVEDLDNIEIDISH